MRYKISQFEFDSVSLVLSKNGETIAIRHNEAKVLALLLENVAKVLNKEDILSHVWRDKVVSEQAVFQNISNLRSLFGNQAIKTFSKRGYQWQLSIEENCDVASSNIPAKLTLLEEINSIVTKPAQPSYWTYAVVVSIILIIVGFWNGLSRLNNNDNNDMINMAYIPIIDQKSMRALPMKGNDNFNFTELTHISSSTFITSSEFEYPNLAEKHPFILTGKTRSYQQKIYLDFLLKGPFADWQGQLSADSTEELIKSLQQHLNQSFIYQFLNSPQSPEFKKSSLSLAHQQFPQDSIILCQLINAYIETQELDKAMALTEKLVTNAKAQDDLLQQGNALLHQSTILTRKDLFNLSADKLSLAIEAFESINDLSRSADAWNAQSWLDHQFDDYPSVKASLLKSAQLALEVNDKARELHALTYLSILAHKHKQQDDKYSYLRLAENKMKTYQLPIYHFAKIPFHYAIFAKTPQDKEPHLKQVLEFTKLTPEHWVSQSSRKQLVLQYIEQKRLNEAEALVGEVTTDNAQNSYLKTLIAKEKQQVGEFITYAQRTFEQAQLAGEHTLSLDIALLLCSTPNIDVNYDFYTLYIDENASDHWRRTNETKLLALNR